MAFVPPVPVTGTRRVYRGVVYQSPTLRATLQPSERPTNVAFDMAKFSELLYAGQKHMCAQLETIDGSGQFGSDPWQSDDYGSGMTKVLQQGAVFEKAGVNVSVVQGVLSEQRAAAMRSRGRSCEQGSHYHAAALSFVCHAQSPFIPTLRGDVRVFATGDQFWGGGGADLTIFYVNKPQIRNFHRHWKRVCDEFDPAFYMQVRKKQDEALQKLRLRREQLATLREYRGVGGIFYDDVLLPQEVLLAFQSRVLSEFLASYKPLIRENRRKNWTKEQKKWQRIRRGRYLEFNLLEDRGVRFGLAGAKPSRTDAIMISAPPSVEWPYGYFPKAGSDEERTLMLLRGDPLPWALTNKNDL